MDDDYPVHLLKREPAPPYDGEGPFALWHFSEDPSLGQLRPRTTPTNPQAPTVVWAVDTRHAPMFWFPRDCPARLHLAEGDDVGRGPGAVLRPNGIQKGARHRVGLAGTHAGVPAACPG